MVVLEGGAVSYEPGNPVRKHQESHTGRVGWADATPVDLIRIRICDDSGSQKKSLHTCILLVITKPHLVQISRTVEPAEYLSSILAAIRSESRSVPAARV